MDMQAFILDQDFESIKVVDSFESMIWTDRYAKAGDFEIYASANDELRLFAKPDYYLWMAESDHLMIIEGSEISSDSEDGDRIIITGRSLESILERRIIWNQTNLNGNLQNGIKRLINDAIINPAIPGRKISNFVFVDSTDPYITGLKIDSQYTGDNLYDVIVELCEKHKIGFKVWLDFATKEFKFQLYFGQDRSYDQDSNPYVVFSQGFENIINADYLESKKAYKNVTLIAGEGEGAERRTQTVGTVTGLERRELFTDARDISSKVDDRELPAAEYNAKLISRGEEKLAEYKIQKTFDGEVETFTMFKYGEDFFLGDVVQVNDDYGNESKSRVIEMIMSQDKDKISAYPTFDIIEDEEENNK